MRIHPSVPIATSTNMPVVMPVVMIGMVFPDQINHYGTLFGGHALRLMDKAAGKRCLCAQGKFILVALDEAGKPTTVETFRSQSHQEKK
jgi:acyl-CoA hydrolase